MIREAIRKVIRGRDLAEEEMLAVMERITDGQATPAQIGALLAGLRMKGETVEEISGAARALRARCLPLPSGGTGTLIDTCGTGGDGSGTFNISTTAAFVAAGAGLKVAKHGNRAVSSRCGSADVLEALGVDLDLTPDRVGRAIDRIGIGFFFAPLWHGSMGRVAGPRQELGLRTIFNLLGPLTNPAGARIQVMGVFRPELTELMARALGRLGCKSALVVFGQGGYDELTVTGPSRITRLHKGRIKTFNLSPEEVGLERAGPEEIAGGDAAQNAALLRSVLEGRPGACRDVVLLNAAAALVAAGLVRDIPHGIALAGKAVDSGQALAKLEGLAAFSAGRPARPEAA
jgi:anthranilate phosphoribosyltransferase